MGAGAEGSHPRWRRCGGIATLAAGLLIAQTGGDVAGAGFEEPPISLDEPSDPVEPAAGVSLDLRLATAEIVHVDRDDDEHEFVRYRFATPIDEALDERRFLVIGRDPRESERAQVLFRDEEDPRRVIAGFEPGTDVSAFALAAVEVAAVADLSGEVNPRGTALIGDPDVVPQSPTVAPDLVLVRRFPNLERADFVFDEVLDERTDVDARDFGFFTTTGLVARGDEVISVEDEVVTVAFAEADGDQVEEGVRFFVLGDAVRDRQGNGNPLQDEGGTTTVPDLVAIEPVDPGSARFDFVFDEPVANAESGRFAVYASNGAVIRAEALSRPGPDTVRAAFPAVEELADELSIGAVLPGAVRSDDPSHAKNTVGSVVLPVELDDGGGPTLGPDLLTADVEVDTGQVTLVFDERIDDDAPVRAADISLITPSGTLVPPRAVVESDDDQVVAFFDQAVAAGAVAISVRTGAVHDFLGNPNPLATLLLTPPA